MKKIGTLNTHLSLLIAGMGHTDRLVICDSGLPIPEGRHVVDLALTANIPAFLDTVRVVLEELQVEEAIVAEEMVSQSNGLYASLRTLLPGVEPQAIAHEAFKALTRQEGNVAFVRTGEATPYANIILVSGVTF